MNPALLENGFTEAIAQCPADKQQTAIDLLKAYLKSL